MSIEDRKFKEKQERHNAILNAAEKIMLEHGLYGLNMDLVAKETQLAKGTLYLYFKNKEDILAELSLKSRQLLLNEFKEATINISSPIEKIKAIILSNFNFYKKKPLYSELVSLYEINKQLTETLELQNASMDITKLVLAITEQAKIEGTLNSELDPMLFTISIWGMTTGMVQLLKVRGQFIEKYQGITEKQILSSYLSIIENGFRK